MRFSGGFAYVHPFRYVLVPVDLSVRIVKGLNIDFGAEAGIAPTEDHGLVWLPSGQAGLSYRFEIGPVQPRLGAVVRLGADSSLGDEGSIGLRIGWAIRAGVDFTPGNGPMILSIDLQGGMFGAPVCGGAVGGAGFRF